LTEAAALILMVKAPWRSKRRLAADLGDAGATDAAARLAACALEDLAAWPGPAWAAPAAPEDRAWLRGTAPDVPVVPQGDGNLGQRIERVSRALETRGFRRQFFIGIDCPELDRPYLERAAHALDAHDVVLGPSRDGGVVLMGVKGTWPPLGALPWSTETLGAALDAACRAAGLVVATLEPKADIDTFSDLAGLGERLGHDVRPARAALRRWLEAAGVERRR